MNKSNYILLGVAISYILIAIIQIKIDGLLPATVYVTVVFISFEFTVFEMIKNLIVSLMYSLKMMNKITKSRTEFIDRSIKTYDKFNLLDSEIELMKNELTELPNSNVLARNNRQIKALNKLLSVTSCIQIIICTVQIMITPLKLIPYDKLTNELINVITLISFALMFLSYFFSSIRNEQDNFQEERWRICETTCFEYLKILEKVASDTENK